MPAAVTIPRYQAIMDRNEERRARVKQESIAITKAREKPFKFWEAEKRRQEEKKRRLEEPPVNPECNRPAFKANDLPRFSSFPLYEEDLKYKER